LNRRKEEINSVTYPVCDTQITASTFFKVPTMSLLVKMLAASSNPNRLWSVKTVRIPMKCECRIPSCPMDERLACAWIKCICSRRKIVRRYGSEVKKLGRVADEAIGRKGM
jgi:hypothetical protein